MRFLRDFVLAANAAGGGWGDFWLAGLWVLLDGGQSLNPPPAKISVAGMGKAGVASVHQLQFRNKRI